MTKTSSRRVGYARVSTRDQNPQMQLDALAKAGVETVFTDKGVSGTLVSRPELDKALDSLRDGDVLVVWKLDRLGRNTRNLLLLVEELEERGVKLHSLTEGIDTSGPMGKAMLTVISAFAQLERDTLVERTMAGLEVAREAGKLGGRPPKLTPEKVAKAQKLIDSGEYRTREVAAMFKVSPPTLYRALAAARAS